MIGGFGGGEGGTLGPTLGPFLGPILAARIDGFSPLFLVGPGKSHRTPLLSTSGPSHSFARTHARTQRKHKHETRFPGSGRCAFTPQTSDYNIFKYVLLVVAGRRNCVRDSVSFHFFFVFLFVPGLLLATLNEGALCQLEVFGSS